MTLHKDRLSALSSNTALVTVNRSKQYLRLPLCQKQNSSPVHCFKCSRFKVKSHLKRMATVLSCLSESECALLLGDGLHMPN